MKKQINLLYKKQDHARKQLLFSYFRRLTVILVTASTILILTVSYLIFSATQEEKNLTAAKEQLMLDLLPLAAAQSKLAHINDKALFWSRSIVAAPIFYRPYFQLIQSVLPPGADFEAFTITAQGEVAATVSFSDINDYYLFVDAVEQNDFIESFSRLDLDRTGISDLASSTKRPVIVRLSGIIAQK